MSRPLRVLVFLHSFEPGGVERVALRLAGAWAGAGCEVRIAMGRAEGALAKEAPAGVALSYPRRPWRFARLCESLWLTPHLVNSIRDHQPDVLFCAGNTYAIVAVLARLTLGSRCPPIVCKVSNSLDRRDLGGAMRWSYGVWLRVQARLIERFVGLSEATRDELRRFLGLADDRIAVVPDPALRAEQIGARSAPCGREGEGRLFVGVGRLAPQKDFASLIRAFAVAARPDDRLLILGEGPERGRLEALVGVLGLEGKVVFEGHVPDPTPWLAAADALVLSSIYEGAPAVVLEALAIGLPVIATDCSVSIRELLGDGDFGVIVPVGAPDRLASAIAGLETRGFDREAMMAQASTFTVERSAPLYLALMNGLRRSPQGAEAVAEAEAQGELMAGA